MANKIFKISFEHEPIKVADKFDERYYDDESAFFVSKEVFKHEDDDLSFSYQYAIDVEYCEGKFYYELLLVPCANSLDAKNLESIAESCGVDKDEIDIYDINSYGCSINMDCEVVESEEIEDKYLDLIASVFEPIDRLRGFYLDKYVNRIGNTGWDMLYDFIKGEDFLTKVGIK